MISPIFWVFLVLVIVIVGALMLRKKECKLYKEDGKCVSKCNNRIYDFTTRSCVSACPSGTFEANYSDGWKVCTKCEEGKVPYNGSCIESAKCISDGKKIKGTPDGPICLDSCENDDFIVDKYYCVDKCEGSIHPITFKCLSSCGGPNSNEEYNIAFPAVDDNFNNFNICSKPTEVIPI